MKECLSIEVLEQGGGKNSALLSLRLSDGASFAPFDLGVFLPRVNSRRVLTDRNFLTVKGKRGHDPNTIITFTKTSVFRGEEIPATDDWSVNDVLIKRPEKNGTFLMILLKLQHRPRLERKMALIVNNVRPEDVSHDFRGLQMKRIKGDPVLMRFFSALPGQDAKRRE